MRRMIAFAMALLLPGSLLAQDITPMSFIVYEPGSEWNAELPPDQQDLQDHFAFVGKKTDEGKLRAFGMQADEVRGFYLLNGIDGEAEFVATDPGATKGVLSHAKTIGWGVLFDKLSDVQKPTPMSVVWYEPGNAWEKGKPLNEQNIEEHVDYINDNVGNGIVVMGGPLLNGNGGAYLLTETDQQALADFVAKDPGVSSGVFSPRIMGWVLLGAKAKN